MTKPYLNESPGKSWFISVLLLVMVAITCAGTFLRFNELGHDGLWEDELFSVDIILNHGVLSFDDAPFFRRIPVTDIDVSDSFWTAKAADQSPPLYELAGKIVLPIFGDSEAGLRATSALSSVVLLLWVAILAWRNRQEKEGLVFFALLLFFAGSGILVYYSQNARVYAMGTLLSAVMLIQFWRRFVSGWREAAMPKWPEMLVFFAAILAHYNVVVIAAMILSCYFLESLRRRDYAASLRLSSAATLLAGWLAISLHSFSMATKGQLGWMPKMSFQEAFLAVMESVMHNVFGEMQLALFALTITAAMFFFLRSHFTEKVGKIPNEGRFFLSLLLILAIVAVYHVCVAFIIQKSHIAHPRHLIFIVPAFYLVVSICLAEINRHFKPLSILLILAITLSNYPLLRDYMKQPAVDYRSGTEFLAEQLDDGTPVIMMPMLNMGGYRYYLERKSSRHFLLKDYQLMGNGQKLCESLASYAQLGFISPAVHGEKIDAIKAMCGTGFEIVQHGKDGVLAQSWKKREPDMP